MSERSLPTLKPRKKQEAKKLPPNFTDLRPEARAAQAQKQKRTDALRKLWSPRFFLRIVGAVVVLLAVGGILVLTNKSDPVPQNIRSQVHFPILYPKTLPAGYGIDSKTMNVAAGVLVFSIRAIQNTTLSVSEQARPANFDFTQLTGDVQFQTTYGNAIVKVNGEKTTASLVTDKTWLLLNSTGPVATKDIEALLNSFQPLATKH
jgi:hypothetical protein